MKKLKYIGRISLNEIDRPVIHASAEVAERKRQFLREHMGKKIRVTYTVVEKSSQVIAQS